MAVGSGAVRAAASSGAPGLPAPRSPPCGTNMSQLLASAPITAQPGRQPTRAGFRAQPLCMQLQCRPLPAVPFPRTHRPSFLLPTEYMYRALDDGDLSVRKNAVMVLTHLILNDMMKVGPGGGGAGGEGGRLGSGPQRGFMQRAGHTAWHAWPKGGSAVFACKRTQPSLTACRAPCPLARLPPTHCSLPPPPPSLPTAGQGPHCQDGHAAGG